VEEAEGVEGVEAVEAAEEAEAVELEAPRRRLVVPRRVAEGGPEVLAAEAKAVSDMAAAGV